MAYTPFQFLRGNTAQNNAYTGQPGEITIDTELNQIRLHDGVTPGGHIIANQENTSLNWNDIVNRPSGLISSSIQYSTGSYTGSFTGVLTSSGHLIPTQNELFDLGSPDKKWRDLYLSGSTIYLGDIALKVVNGQLILVNQLTQTNPAFSGSFTGSLLGSSSYALTASYVPNAVSSWDDISGKPTVVSSSTQISFTDIQDKPTLVSSSNQISYTGIQNKPTTIDTASYVTYENIANKPTLVSESAQVTLNQISGTTFSNNTFYFPQDIIVEGKVTAQEYHTELISSSVIYQSGSTKFGDSANDIHQFTGSLQVNGGITGSLFGTSSWTERSVSSSYALNTDKARIAEQVEVVPGGSTTGQGIYLGEFTGSLYGTASYALNTGRGDGFPYSGSAVITGSLLVSSSGITLIGAGLTGSVFGTSSRAISSSHADLAEKIEVVSGGSTTGEGIYRGEFTGSLFGTSSYALNAGKGDGFPYSGSAVITGSLLVSGSGITGSLQGTASNAISSSYSVTASYSQVAQTSSRSISTEKIDVISGGSTTGEGIYKGEFTGSLFGTSSYALNTGRGDGFPYSGSAIITGSLLVSGSGITGSLFGTSSNSISSSYSAFTVSASYGLTANYANTATSASYSITSSYAESATTASRSLSTEKIDVISGGSTTGDGIYRGEFTGSLYGTASYALNASKGAGFPFSGSAEITGSLLISGSGLRTTGSIRVFGDIDATGGFLGTSSYAQTSSYALFVLQNTFTGSFKGDGSQLYFNTLNTSQSSNSELIIGNIYNDYQYKQTTVFRNAEVVISGSTTITNGGVLFMTPQETPTPIAGGIFFSSSGQFFIGTE